LVDQIRGGVRSLRGEWQARGSEQDELFHCEWFG
jgi:hypothetical protein